MPLRATKKDLKVYQMNLSGDAEEVSTPAKRNNEEEREQALFFAERNYWLQHDRYQQGSHLFSTLNGVKLSAAMSARMKACGMCRGIMDIWYPFPNDAREKQRFVGLVMDMKKLNGGVASKEQKEWAKALQEVGWHATFPAGAAEAWRTWCCYVGIDGPNQFAESLERRADHLRHVASKR